MTSKYVEGYALPTNFHHNISLRIFPEMGGVKGGQNLDLGKGFPVGYMNFRTIMAL